MEEWFDSKGVLRIDEIVIARPSFQRVMADGKVTAEEYQAQTALVADLLHKLEKQLPPDAKSLATDTLGELAVLMALSVSGRGASEGDV